MRINIIRTGIVLFAAFCSRIHADPRPNFLVLTSDDQMYDPRRDPQVKRNLALNPEYAAVLREMQEYLSRYVRDIGRQFVEFK